MSLESYEKELLICDSLSGDSEIIFGEIADKYEDDLLEYDDFPEEYFRFLLKLLSNKIYFSKPGLWNFLSVIGTENHKLEFRHYEELSNCFIQNFICYEDKTLCLSICDFIVGNYNFDLAEKLLLRLKEIEKEKKEKGFADDGLKNLYSIEKKRNGEK